MNSFFVVTVPFWWAILAGLVLVGLWVILTKSPRGRGRGPAPPSAPGGLEITAMILLLIGGIVGLILGLLGVIAGWGAGVVLLWISRRWRWPDKLLATLVWPGGLVPGWFLASSLPGWLGRTCISSTGAVPARCFQNRPPPWTVILTMAVLLLGPLAVAARLWHKARRLPSQSITGGSAAPIT